MLTDNLIELGLSHIEAEVLETITKVGPCFVAPLVHATKKHRQIVYNALESLKTKKLILITKKNNKNYYQIADPDRFILSAKQNLVLANQVSSQIKHYLKKDREIVEVFDGPQSYEQGLADFRKNAEEAKEYIVIGGESKDWYEFTSLIFSSHVEELKKLKRNGIDILILFYEAERGSAQKYIHPYLHNPYVCRIADDKHRLPQTSWVAGSYVYILTPTIEPLVISIKSASLAEQYRSIFWRQWKDAKMLK